MFLAGRSVGQSVSQSVSVGVLKDFSKSQWMEEGRSRKTQVGRTQSLGQRGFWASEGDRAMSAEQLERALTVLPDGCRGPEGAIPPHRGLEGGLPTTPTHPH